MGGRGELQWLGPRLGWACTPACTHCLTPGQTLASEPLAVLLWVRNGTRRRGAQAWCTGTARGLGQAGTWREQRSPLGAWRERVWGWKSGWGEGAALSLCWSGQWCQKLKPLPSLLSSTDLGLDALEPAAWSGDLHPSRGTAGGHQHEPRGTQRADTAAGGRMCFLQRRSGHPGPRPAGSAEPQGD